MTKPGHFGIPGEPNATVSALDMVLDLLAAARAEEAIHKARAAVAREQRRKPQSEKDR